MRPLLDNLDLDKQSKVKIKQIILRDLENLEREDGEEDE